MKKEIAILSAVLILLTGCASKTDDAKNAPAEQQGGFQVLDADPIAATTTNETGEADVTTPGDGEAGLPMDEEVGSSQEEVPMDGATDTGSAEEPTQQ
ncbi:hypothetical protein L6270_02285 [Candidatus Parcubacteria bacterium]|nr:hypothetical protein [Patescibacteria group bacterium]MBU4309485.1 hypothetical protein [Patescibacteria group bacterium]MBU4432107.1 hypothetical protein [Patescibacteria group bacterium]MBU4577191.1 hypothetical protein [Patescibacteria group bacterium]MCG2696839.1 hypothetical protein [Candidatus Parcubacteria bacterium]